MLGLVLAFTSLVYAHRVSHHKGYIAPAAIDLWLGANLPIGEVEIDTYLPLSLLAPSLERRDENILEPVPMSFNPSSTCDEDSCASLHNITILGQLLCRQPRKLLQVTGLSSRRLIACLVFH